MGFLNWTGTVLLVEDNSDVARLHGQFLEDGGMQVTTVTTLAAALRAMNHVVFDCIVLDLMLPDVSLEEANEGKSIEAIREVTLSIPLVVVTGYAEVPQTLGVHQAQEWLLKPIHPASQIVDAVRAAVTYMAGVTRMLAKVEHKLHEVATASHAPWPSTATKDATGTSLP
jgi:two-component system response regulator HydG